MAVVSSHVLDAVTGAHAGEVRVECRRLAADGTRQTIFDVHSGQDGRISETVDLDVGEPADVFELVFYSGEYFARQQLPTADRQPVRRVVIRLAMPDPEARYHVPVIVSPHGYSVWWSG